eukprot:COSAG02_NODE_1139_length_14295_cov_63.689279_1_plen_45_part_00
MTHSRREMLGDITNEERTVSTIRVLHAVHVGGAHFPSQGRVLCG